MHIIIEESSFVDAPILPLENTWTALLVVDILSGVDTFKAILVLDADTFAIPESISKLPLEHSSVLPVVLTVTIRLAILVVPDVGVAVRKVLFAESML
jgi:hypothetical protein